MSPRIEASATGVVPYPPGAVYEVLADYRDGHPSILPPEFFRGFAVEHGGRGAGTRIGFAVRSFGVTRHFHAVVSEPEPGRRLVEADVESGIETTFSVEGLQGGTASRVEISTSYARSGPRGWIERLLAPRFLRRVYAAELERLAAVLTRRAAAGGAKADG